MEYVVGFPSIVCVFLVELNLLVRHDAKIITTEVYTWKNSSILQAGKRFIRISAFILICYQMFLWLLNIFNLVKNWHHDIL